MNPFKHLARCLPGRRTVAALARIEALARTNLVIGITLMEDFAPLQTTVDAQADALAALDSKVDGLIVTAVNMAKDILALRADAQGSDNQAQIDAIRAKAQANLDALTNMRAKVADADAAAEAVEPDPVPAPPADAPPADTPPAPAPDDIAIL